MITRDRNGTSRAAGTGRGFWPLDSRAGRWYRLETNFDNWEPLTDGRREAAHASMDALGQSAADVDGLFSVLSQPPVLAHDTTYTATMANALGLYSTTVREHDADTNALLRQRMVTAVSAKMRELLAWFRQQPLDPQYI